MHESKHVECSSETFGYIFTHKLAKCMNLKKAECTINHVEHAVYTCQMHGLIMLNVVSTMLNQLFKRNILNVQINMFNKPC